VCSADAYSSFENYIAEKPFTDRFVQQSLFNNKKLSDHLSYSSSLPYIWPAQSYQSISGLAVEPLYKSVPYAALDDNFLYEVFALIDVFRIGSPREKKIAEKLLREYLQ